jgi:molybdopterin-synthase adenylyltransferase
MNGNLPGTLSLNSDRFARQLELVPSAALQDLTVSVIGVGAIGRQVALQLAAIGATHIQLFDFDLVEVTNITTQAYRAIDVGQPKVAATAAAIHEIEPSIQVEPIADRFRPKYPLGSVVFCCVDSIATRAAIWRTAGRSCHFWADGRMLGEVLRILAAACPATRNRYATSLFAQNEAQAGTCTSRSTLYAASIAAGLMMHQFTRWLRQLPLDADVTFNLLAGELSAGGSCLELTTN